MKKIIIMLTSFCLLTACSSGGAGGMAGRKDSDAQPQTAAEVPEHAEQPDEVQPSAPIAVESFSRPALISSDFSSYSTSIDPHESYNVAPDLSNTVNYEKYKSATDQFKRELSEKLFVIAGAYNKEFFMQYINCSALYEAVFITTDSMLHAFHLYYQHLQKTLEQTTLSGMIRTMSAALLAKSQEQYDALKGTEWESAAKRNVDYFSVAMNLIGEEAEMSAEARHEYDLCMEAGQLTTCELFTVDPGDPQMADYTQFKPRSYYTESEELERYFRTMMWYGQMNFTQKYEDLDRSALLMNMALRDAGFDEWEGVYTITAFFSGESDDNGWYEYMPVINAVYGEGAAADVLAGDNDKWNAYHELTGKLGAPKINSMPVYDPQIEPDLESRITGYRLMGSRFTIDADILQNLVFQKVGENSEGKTRTLPNGLDVPAALGSDTALEILTDLGETEYENYPENMDALRETFKNEDDPIWSASVYSSWLKTMRPLLREKGEDYPPFMKGERWAKKDLITFMGSYAELKHDNQLYVKQPVYGLGADGPVTTPDDRGYVECEPEVFLRLSELAQFMAEGLQKYNAISEEDIESLSDFSELASDLQVIAEKELRNELPTDEEFDLIRNYGEMLRELWVKSVDEPADLDENPIQIITDIATDQSGYCLEIGIAMPNNIYSAVYFDGGIHICAGSIFSYYEFTQPITDRLTDAQWRERLNNWDDPQEMPAWEMSVIFKEQ